MIQSKFCCDKLVLMFVWLFLRVRSRKIVWFVASNQEKTNTYVSASLTFYNMKHLPLQSTSFGEHCNNYQRRVQVSIFSNIWKCVSTYHHDYHDMFCLTGTMMIHFSNNILTFRYQTIELLIYYRRKQRLDK